MDKVSVIIPSFNRFKFLLNAIKSVKEQTHNNLEIIVINDSSTDKSYYEYDWEKNNIIIIHLEENSKKKFGYGCVGYIRNQGIKKATGKYISFCDDDDIWFPRKLELQIAAMKKNNCKMSSTDGLTGEGVYNSSRKYLKFNEERHFSTLKKIYKSHGNLLDKGFPDIWDLNFLKIHNCMITSSVILEKEVVDKIGLMSYKQRGQDYLYWLKALEHTNSVYIRENCFYYDESHGHGQNH